jgi:hypothetical protein
LTGGSPGGHDRVFKTTPIFAVLQESSTPRFGGEKNVDFHLPPKGYGVLCGICQFSHTGLKLPVTAKTTNLGPKTIFRPGFWANAF